MLQNLVSVKTRVKISSDWTEANQRDRYQHKINETKENIIHVVHHLFNSEVIYLFIVTTSPLHVNIPRNTHRDEIHH